MIYYLDDEANMLNIVASYMTQFGFSIQTFERANDLLEQFKLAPANVVILDYRLTETSGLHIAKQLPNVPKILVTGELDINKPEEFDYLLNKPFKLAELKETVKMIYKGTLSNG
jgi:FixJ family two-component response regulator